MLWTHRRCSWTIWSLSVASEQNIFHAASNYEPLQRQSPCGCSIRWLEDRVSNAVTHPAPNIRWADHHLSCMLNAYPLVIRAVSTAFPNWEDHDPCTGGQKCCIVWSQRFCNVWNRHNDICYGLGELLLQSLLHHLLEASACIAENLCLLCCLLLLHNICIHWIASLR